MAQPEEEFDLIKGYMPAGDKSGEFQVPEQPTDDPNRRYGYQPPVSEGDSDDPTPPVKP